MDQNRSYFRRGLHGRLWIHAIVFALPEVFAVSLYPAAPLPDTSVDLELQVKAVFIYNFAKFTQWPDQALPRSAPIVIGVIGNDAITGFLHRTVDGKAVEGHPARTVQVKTLAEARDCQILFFAGLPDRRALDILSAVSGDSILTVGEDAEFALAGGMLQLYLDNNHVVFGANMDAVGRSSVRLSSRLLKLARTSPTGK